MKKALICLVAALVLMLPVYIGMANIQPLEAWFMSGAGWAALEPWFRLCNAIGIHGDGRILTNTMLFFSFVVSLVAVCLTARLSRKFWSHTTKG